MKNPRCGGGIGLAQKGQVGDCVEQACSTPPTQIDGVGCSLERDDELEEDV